MLKLNTVLTAVCVVLAAMAGYFGKCIWEDVAAIKSATTMQAIQVQSLTRQVDDHETRIRQTERDVTILQQVQREDRTVRPPKMTENH